MNQQDVININIFKVITKAITQSDDLELMANQLCQLLTAALNIKGSAIFVLDDERTELQPLASFGLSSKYLTKGPINPSKSLGCTIKQEAIVISDITSDDRLQYPQHALDEGIYAIMAIPIIFKAQPIGSFRLYHHQPWTLSDQDIDSLFLFGEVLGMGLRYTSLFNAVSSIYEIMNELPLKQY